MNYPQTLDWLFAKLPMFQHSGASAYKEDLTNIRLFCEHLNHPQNKFKSIHVAGTNGKGSTSHMLASILQNAGYKVGLTTSPHLKDFRERIRVNGKMCPKKFVNSFVKENAEFIENLHASFFEVSIAMAFSYFEKEKVDIAIVETGLGGRLDSTNIITPILSVITNIGLDHVNILGDTLSKIAFEKAGIMKDGIPVVLGEVLDETRPVFIQKAKETFSKVIFAESVDFPDYESDLKGVYQQKNKRTVLTAIEELRNQGFVISENAVRDGLKNVIKTTGLRGRWEKLQSNPFIVADTAHNPHGLAEIKKQIAGIKFNTLHLVLGFVNDKDVLSILGYFPSDAIYYFSAPNVPRKLTVNDLKNKVPSHLNATYYASVNQALEAAKENASTEDMIYIGGSTFVVAEVV